MKKLFFLAAILLISSTSFAQTPQIKSPPPGGNKKAMVGERIGITDVTIHYDRPGVRGREDKIYGPVVYEGYSDLSLEGGTSKKAPWRAGANENTTIEFSTDVTVEGKPVAAGKYGLFIAYGPLESWLILSKDNNAWGSYFYDEKNDALRVKIKTKYQDKSEEWLKYEFTSQTPVSAKVELHWEKVYFPFTIEVDFVKTQIEEFRNALKTDQFWNWEANKQAADFCLANNTNLAEGMEWAERAMQFNKNFKTQTTYAAFLKLNGKTQKADSLMKLAVAGANMNELHQYGRKLLSEKKTDEAFEIFKTNLKNNPKQFTTYVGMARAYAAKGDFKNALSNAKAALPLAPDEVNKKYWSDMIKKLEEGKDIN